MMLPLEGIKIVDLSRALAGPYCTAMLADFGAEVIKVESLGSGDPSRNWPPFDADGRSLYYESINRSKRSLTIDFYSDKGREILSRLIREADVLVENFKFGTLSKMGFSENELESLNPDLLLVSINAYGSEGPLRDLPGLDQVIQGASGITSVTGPQGGSGYRVGLPIVDITSGMNGAFAVVTALLGKSRGIQSSRVSTSLLESALGLSVFQGQQALTLDEAPEAQGNSHPSIAPYGAYDTASEPIIVAVSTPKHWSRFTTILGTKEWLSDPRFATGEARSRHRVELDELIKATLCRKKANYWIEMFRESGIPSGPINDYRQAIRSEQAGALGMVQCVPRKDGSEIELIRSPMSIDGKTLCIRNAAPSFGQHSVGILQELGMDPGEIAELHAQGVIGIGLGAEEVLNALCPATEATPLATIGETL
ncbi:CaiB/BaiF CoA transferase family protein [Glutamicibacter sp. AOP12-B1-11]|uniref:CaiB/BaiF CoA transferase family protein n=1 Tax=Glutamicibacter sp. AOP12-B1-11 TaxID=3457725 RepID=UPI0040349429